jgi:hypothetical protein
MRYFVLLLASVLLVLCASCGGSGNSTQVTQEQGRVRVTINWPELKRAIPNAAQSIKLTAIELVPDEEGVGFTEDEILNTKVVTRPEGPNPVSTEVLDLPAIKVRIRAQAFESTTGTGQIIATGSTDVDVTSNGSANASISLSVAVTQITVQPSSLTMEPNADEVLTATAKDADGNTILVPSSDLTWSSTNTSVVIVAQRAAPNGNTADVSALQGGSSTVRVTHTPTGVFKDVLVNVPTGVTISPSGAVLQPAGTKQFTASATGDPGAQFTWSVNGGGTINPATGLFTAGNTSGNFTVTASVVGDPGRVGTASVRVGIPPLFEVGYTGTNSENSGGPTPAVVTVEFNGGEIRVRFAINGNSGRLIAIQHMDETSFSGVLADGDFIVQEVTGQVTVSGNIATLTMNERVDFGGGSVLTNNFVGTRVVFP